jgi:hypothetical protein
MVVHRMLGEHQLLSDLAVGEPPPDEEGDFLLAGGERFGGWLLRYGDERRRGTLLLAEGVLACRFHRHCPTFLPSLGPSTLLQLGLGSDQAGFCQCAHGSP